MECAGQFARLHFNFGWRQLWARAFSVLAKHRPQRRLRVAESLALGEKRQLFVIEYEQRRFLIGAAGNFVAMMAELEALSDANTEQTRT